jgi:hypothetical protein
MVARIDAAQRDGGKLERRRGGHSAGRVRSSAAAARVQRSENAWNASTTKTTATGANGSAARLRAWSANHSPTSRECGRRAGTAPRGRRSSAGPVRATRAPARPAGGDDHAVPGNSVAGTRRSRRPRAKPANRVRACPRGRARLRDDCQREGSAANPDAAIFSPIRSGSATIRPGTVSAPKRAGSRSACKQTRAMQRRRIRDDRASAAQREGHGAV